MNFADLAGLGVGAVLVAVLAVYLTAVLIHPEKF